MLGEPDERSMPHADGPQHWFGLWKSENVDVLILFNSDGNVDGGSWGEWYDHDHQEGRDHKILPPPSYWERVTSWIEW